MRAYLCCLSAVAIAFVPLVEGASAEEPAAATARIVAVGLPGAGAVAQVGTFHAGGPIHDKPEFAAFTAEGKVLDPNRVLVTSTSNFGAPKARANEPEGAALSIDTSGTDVIVIPPDFAAHGDQASALGGKVQLFTAQSPAFINGINTPNAVTAALAPVSNPLGISINNGFGRLWFANTPAGPGGIGTESIVDPGGQPLASAPSQLAGGVFAGDQTNRAPQLIAGALRSGAIASALLGMSSDGSKRAVFAVLTADGAIAQAHTERNLDGLAPAGTVSPITVPGVDAAATAPVTRAGMLFNWVPNRIIYVSDPVRNAIVALTVGDDGKVFTVTAQRRIELPELSAPVDLAPVVPEIANPGFSSNTTLAGTSDIYAVNRGNGTVVRLTQEGKLVAVRRVALGTEPLGPNRLNGIAVSRDAQRIFLTVSGGIPGHADKPGALIEIAAFGPGRAANMIPRGEPSELAQRGAGLFATAFTAEQGLGPLYNETSCSTCHAAPRLGGMAPDGLGLAMRVGAKSGDDYDPLVRDGGPIARRHLIAGLGAECGLTPGIPAAANVVSLRNAPDLFGAGLIDRISDAVIVEGADRQQRSGAARGRPHMVSDGAGVQHVGRFGWKADTASLRQFVADAMRNELGLTNPLASRDSIAVGKRCGQYSEPHDDGTILAALYAFVAELAPPPAAVGSDNAEGRAMFASVGCAVCHTPELASPGGVSVPLYSDLLLHDMGTALDDGVVQGQARGSDWRTTPLWGLGDRIRYLHDGRAQTLTAAILAHDGEAAPATKAFLALPMPQRDQLLTFLRSL